MLLIQAELNSTGRKKEWLFATEYHRKSAAPAAIGMGFLMKCPACDCEMTEMELGGVSVDACHGGWGVIWS